MAFENVPATVNHISAVSPPTPHLPGLVSMPEGTMVWFCHECREGPMTVAIHKKCSNPDCQHPKCSRCTEEHVEGHRSSDADTSFGPSPYATPGSSPDIPLIAGLASSPGARPSLSNAFESRNISNTNLGYIKTHGEYTAAPAADGELLWFCCQCTDGPKALSLWSQSCTICDHKRCPCCKVEEC